MSSLLKKELEPAELQAVLVLACTTAIGANADAVAVGLKIIAVGIQTNRPPMALTCALVLPLLQHTLQLFNGCLGHPRCLQVYRVITAVVGHPLYAALLQGDVPAAAPLLAMLRQHFQVSMQVLRAYPSCSHMHPPL